MKKIISSFIIFILLLSQWVEAYAVSITQLPKKQTTYVVAPINTAVIPEKKVPPPKKYTTTISNIWALNGQLKTQFILPKYDINLANGYITDLGNKTVKVNFQDITVKNAGTIVKVWNNPSDYPKKFILESGMSVALNIDEVSKKLAKTNTVKSKVTTYKSAWIQVWEIKSELRMLPDRLQLFETVELTYRSKNQLDIIRKDIYTNNEVSNQLQTLAKQNIQPINKRGLSDTILAKAGFADMKKLPTTQEGIDEQTTEGLIATCIEQFGSSDPQCDRQSVLSALDGAEKTITVEEKVEVPLIPPTSFEGWFDFTHKTSDEVRITRKQILGIFKNYWVIKNIKKVPVPEDPEPFVGDAPIPLKLTGNLLNQLKYCEVKFPKGTSDIEIHQANCIDLMLHKKAKTTEIYSKDLLNGFTLGEAQSYEWHTRQRVNLWVKKITLYELGIRFYYSYGFGIRIPMQSKIRISDSQLDNHPTSAQDYRIDIGIQTLDGDEGFYSSVGIDPNKIFAGKEFVLEVSAGIQLNAYVIGIGGFNIDIGIMSLLAQYFSDILVNQLGIPQSDISTIIAENKFDKWKNFSPPFAGQSAVSLLSVQPTFPIYSAGIFTLLGRLIIDASITWEIQAKCHMMNSVGWCNNQTLKFANSNTKNWHDTLQSIDSNSPAYTDYNTKRWMSLNAKAVIDNPQGSDDLGLYDKFWLTLDTFQYIPTLIVNLLLQWGLKIGLPYIGSIEFWTPTIKIFSMEYSGDDYALDTHDGTDGILNAYMKNKIYKAAWVTSDVILNQDEIDAYNERVEEHQRWEERQEKYKTWAELQALKKAQELLVKNKKILDELNKKMPKKETPPPKNIPPIIKLVPQPKKIPLPIIKTKIIPPAVRYIPIKLKSRKPTVSWEILF